MGEEMGNIAVGIDTSKDKGRRSKGTRLIAAVIGKPSELNAFVHAVDRTARQNGFTGTLHWKHIKTATRERILAEHAASLPKHALAAVILASSPSSEDKRQHYLEHCPAVIASEIARFVDERIDKIAIMTDTDFDSLAPSKDPPRQAIN